MGVHMRIFVLSSGGKPDSCGRMWEMFSSPNQCSQQANPCKGFKRMASNPFLFLFHGLILWVGQLMTGPAHANMPAAYQLETDWMLDAKPYAASWHEDPVTGICTLQNGLVARRWVLAPNAATIGVDNLMTGAPILRSIRPEASLIIDGMPFPVGGLQGQPNHAFIREEWIENMREMNGSLRYTHYQISQPLERFPWKRVRHHAPDAVWPPKGIQVDFHYSGLVSGKETSETKTMPQPLEVVVHYILYDGVPAFSKWMTVTNQGDQPVNLDHFESEILAVIPREDPVETREGVSIHEPNLHVETDYAFGGFSVRNSRRHSVHWQPDPAFHTQVNYLKQNPCLLKVAPERGPDQTLFPGKPFESFRTFMLIYDSEDRMRQGLALRRMYRTIAPWVTENPLILHLTTTEEASVLQAIEQAAICGFEIVNFSFGSGLNMENRGVENHNYFKKLVTYAASKGIELGGYSLLSSRRISPDSDNCIHPETGKPGGQTHGFAPALASDWGQQYLESIQSFFESTGFSKFVHDGSYPGDWDAASRPPLQKGLNDSQWVQWKLITRLYQWMRSEGIYLRVPDYYYLNGANEAGMGYREVNWSLPRLEQQIHTRQNIFDGTWEKTPSMGWMFVPLTEYHGGGEQATIEPLSRHWEHYQTMLLSNLGAGVQAVYRGHRLFDSDHVREGVTRTVQWFKSNRDILESDLIHTSSRRADGTHPDWYFHANPKLKSKGLWIGFNPSNKAVKMDLLLNVYFTGLTDQVRILPRGNQGNSTVYTLDRHHRVKIPVDLPAHGTEWFLIEEVPRQPMP